MVYSRYFYVKIIFNLLLIIGLSGLEVWLFLQDNTPPILLIIIALTILLRSASIVFYFDKIQQKIAYFFNAVENEDSTLHYTEKTTSKSLQKLHKSLNRVNLLIQETKLKNKEQEQYFAALLEQVSTGIVVINPNGNILQSNTAAKQLLNYSTLTHIVQLKQVDENLYQAFTKLAESNRQLVKLHYNNTTTQLTLQATTFKSKDMIFKLVSIQDIRNELDAKEVESWLKLIRVLTHEIMNSITPITSLSDTLINYYQSSDEDVSQKTIDNTIKGLEVIRERGNGLIHFVNSYRKLTRLSKPALKTIPLNPLIEQIIMLVRNGEANLPIHFVYHVIPETLTIEADENQLSQVLINLIKNAIEAVKNTENPTIKVIADLNEENRPQISVADNGFGISEEVLDHIFVPFFTTKENGSGIGLSISRQIMRNHGGNIKVFSQEGEGSRFVLEF